MVGTLLPLESYEHCIDSVETPKTVALQQKFSMLHKIKERVKTQNPELVDPQHNQESTNSNQFGQFVFKFQMFRRQS